MHPKARRGIELFNQGKYFEAHEALEAAWMETGVPERDLYQGILQIGLAYFQISRGSYRGAIKMFGRGQRNLKALGDTLLNVDLSKLREQALIVENSLRNLGPDHLDELDPGLIKPVPLFE
jgi:predicted metal-dependent hydrolase